MASRLSRSRQLTKHNNDFKYLLTCVDILSKYAWVMPLKNKTSKNIINALEKIFSDRKPKFLQTDKGKEFLNINFQNYLKSLKILFFTTHSELKASVVERFNRTLKTKMWKYFTQFNTRKYIDVLDDLMYSYNHSVHRSIKMKPVSVTKENEKLAWKNLYGRIENPKSPRLKVGDIVRISKQKMKFEKGYEQNWSRELFSIYEVLAREIPVYKLKDLSNEIIKGSFYVQELQKVNDSGYYLVENVLKKRKVGGKTEYFVKFEGYPKKI